MRLQEVFTICKDVQESWHDLSFEEVKGAGGISYFKLHNAEAIRDILSALDAVESFQETTSAIKKASYGFSQSTGSITIDSRTKLGLLNNYQKLYTKVSTITELFESLNYRQNPEGFDVKLPANMSLSDLSKCTKDLDTIFSTCPLFSSHDGTINFSAVDVGSVWLTFLVAGTATTVILGLIAKLVDKALIMRSHYLTSREQEEKIRKLQLGNDLLDNAVSVHKKIGKGLLNDVTAELAKEHDISDPEDIGRLKTSIQLLSNWMNQGMEVYASIRAPEETKAVFPPIEKQSLPEGMVALLTDGTDNEI